jgi:hypothetical protein
VIFGVFAILNLIVTLLPRTLADIVSVVHIGENVVRKRLSEFEATPSADLTLGL